MCNSERPLGTEDDYGDDYDHARSVCLTESVCVSHNFCVTHLSDCERLSVNVSQALFRV